MAYINGKQIMNVNVSITYDNPKITFKVEGFTFNNPFTAMYGMTWGEWCKTEYNTTGFQINANGQVVDSAGDEIFVASTGEYVNSEDRIISGGLYDIT